MTASPPFQKPSEQVQAIHESTISDPEGNSASKTEGAITNPDSPSHPHELSRAGQKEDTPGEPDNVESLENVRRVNPLGITHVPGLDKCPHEDIQGQSDSVPVSNQRTYLRMTLDPNLIDPPAGAPDVSSHCEHHGQSVSPSTLTHQVSGQVLQMTRSPMTISSGSSTCVESPVPTINSPKPHDLGAANGVSNNETAPQSQHKADLLSTKKDSELKPSARTKTDFYPQGLQQQEKEKILKRFQTWVRNVSNRNLPCILYSSWPKLTSRYSES